MQLMLQATVCDCLALDPFAFEEDGPPSAIMLFLSSRLSRVRSATTSFNACASRRRSFTSSEVAARAVSPASRLLPASRNSFD
jgi:hypothetical protein